MRLSSRARYAVTAMLDVAVHGDDSPVCLNDIAERQALSRAYLEQLFSGLRRNGLVDSTRGPGGGYSLNRAADAISIAEVIRAVDEDIDVTGCRGNGDAAPRCVTYELWDELNQQVEGFLADMDLGSLRDRARQRAATPIVNNTDAADCGCQPALAASGK